MLGLFSEFLCLCLHLFLHLNCRSSAFPRCIVIYQGIVLNTSFFHRKVAKRNVAVAKQHSWVQVTLLKLPARQINILQNIFIPQRMSAMSCLFLSYKYTTYVIGPKHCSQINCFPYQETLCLCKISDFQRQLKLWMMLGYGME